MLSGVDCKLKKEMPYDFEGRSLHRLHLKGVRLPAGAHVASSKKNRWVSKVKTDSTHPPAGLFTKKAPVIARALASKKVSPKGPASGMRMLTYFINRAGRGLSPSRRAELNRAKSLLSRRIHGGTGSTTRRP